MRKLPLVLLAVTITSASAQQSVVQSVPQAPAGSNWQHVQVLPVGASIYVKARAHHATCKLKRVDADTLTCIHGKEDVFQRTEIQSIKLTRRGRSTLIAVGLGAGVGAIVGAATTGCSTAERNSFFGCFLTPTRPQGAAIGVAVFGVIATPIGYFSDFARSSVYTAP
jgi:hypothetical protein